MGNLVHITPDRTLNSKEMRFTGWNAVEAAVYTLITTPINTLPEMPSMGFDIDDFLFRSSTDTLVSDLEKELISKLKIVCKDENINCSVYIKGVNVYINISYSYQGKNMSLPISIEEGTNGRIIKFKDIILK